MNIAMMTTWNSACGIAEYTRNLVYEFFKDEHNILVLNNKLTNYNTNPMVAKVFGVHWWGEDSTFNSQEALDAMKEFERRYGTIDVLHIQYQGSLYEVAGFNNFIYGVNCKKVITFHDSSKHPKHNFDSFESIAHNHDINADNYLPFPTIERTPVVCSFGMGGRNNYSFIEEACKEIGIEVWKHDAREDGWVSEEELFRLFNQADAIVLWYNEVPIKGQSAALRTAISSMRPVIVNNVGWFKGAPNFVRKASTKDELQTILAEMLHLEYIRKNSFKELAKKHLEIYNG